MRRRLLAAALMTIGALRVSGAAHVLLHGDPMQPDHTSDLGRFITTARCLHTGCEGYLISSLRADFLPPFAHALFWPLLGMSDTAAAIWWLGISAILLAASWYAVWREIGRPAMTWTAIAIGCVLASTATEQLVYYGQVGAPLAVLMTAGWILWRRGQRTEAAVPIGILIAAKPFLITFSAYWLLTRQWRPFFVSSVTACACYAIGLVAFGWQPHLGWLLSLATVRSTGLPFDASLLALVSRALVPTTWFTPFADGHAVLPALLMLLRIAVLWLGWIAVRRDRHADRVIVLLTVAALLVSPKGWVYYLLMLSGPIAAMALGVDRRALLPLSALLVPAAALLWLRGSAVWSATVGNLAGWCLMGTYGLTVARSYRDRRL